MKVVVSQNGASEKKKRRWDQAQTPVGNENDSSTSEEVTFQFKLDKMNKNNKLQI